MINLYAALEVGPASSEEDIKSAYRRLARRFHPDLNPDGRERFVLIQQAYEVLREPGRRMAYDKLFVAWLERTGATGCGRCGLTHRGLDTLMFCRGCGQELHRPRTEPRASDRNPSEVKPGEAKDDEEQVRRVVRERQEMAKLLLAMAPDVARIAKRVLGPKFKRLLRRWTS